MSRFHTIDHMLAKETLECAKIYLSYQDDVARGENTTEVLTDIAQAINDLAESLKTNDSLRFVYLRDPQEFARLCSVVVQAAHKHATHEGVPFESERTYKASDFTTEHTEEDDRLMRLVFNKRQAFDRLEEELLQSVTKTLQFAPESLESGICGMLARQLVAPVDTGNPIIDTKTEQNAFDTAVKTLRPRVREALAELRRADKEIPAFIRDKMMSDIVCQEYFLTKMVLEPAKSYIKSKVVSA